MVTCSILLRLSRFLTGNKFKESMFGKLFKTHGRKTCEAGEVTRISRSFFKAVNAFAAAGKSFHTSVILSFLIFGGMGIEKS